MQRDRLEEIFDSTESDWDGDNAYQGLQILSKYTSNLIQGAGHDQIFSTNVDDVIDELTEEDAIALAKLNWHIKDDSFACFV